MDAILTLEDTAGPGTTRTRGDVDPDRETLARVAAGDHDAFAALLARHESRIFALCFRLLGDREAARDMVQEVFLQAFRHAGRFRPRARVGTWLYRIAVNRCLNGLRRRRVIRFFRLDTAGQGDQERWFPEPSTQEPTADRRLDAQRRWRAVHERIATLPPGQRVVLILARIEGLRYREIADSLGITVGAVESRLVRAMRRLASLAEGVVGGGS